MEPVGILLLGGVVLGERPGAAIVALSVAAFLGLVGAVGSQVGEAVWVGVALSLAGVLCCVVYSVATRRWIQDSPSTLGVVVLQDVAALALIVVVLVVLAISGSSPVPSSLTTSGVSSTVASGILYYGAAYLLYLSALRELPVSVAAQSFYLVPVFGIAAATLAGETLTATQWLGATTTVTAVLAAGVVDLRRSRSSQPAPFRG